MKINRYAAGVAAIAMAVICAMTLYAEKRFTMSVKLNNGRTMTYDMSNVLKINIDTTGSSAGQWGDGNEFDITSEEIEVDYGPVKIGDYFYSDGSWSDGGYLGLDTTGHGSVKWASPKPAPTMTNPITGEARKVIGIVFCTDSSRLGTAEKAVLDSVGGKFHGLVMSLRIADNVTWCKGNLDDTQFGIPNIGGSKENPLYPIANALTSGLENCLKVKRNNPYAYAADMYPAVRYALEATNYAAAVGGPEQGTRTTGWFIPSTGQWFDLMRNFTGMNLTDTAPFYFTYNEYEVEDGLHFDWQIDYSLSMQAEYKENFVDLLNYPLSAVPTNYKNDFPAAAYFITSTIASTEYIYFIRVLPKIITCRRWQKTTPLQARFVLAF